MAAPARVRREHMTVEEYLALPESRAPMGFVEGEVIVSPMPTVTHQELAMRLGMRLFDWAKGRSPRPFVMSLPVDVQFGPRRILQPDLCVWLGGLRDRRERPVRQIPELCIEVLSEDHDYDRVTKRLIYGDAGVRELWTVDPIGAIEQWSGERLGTWAPVEGCLRSELLPGFELELAALFDALDG